MAETEENCNRSQTHNLIFVLDYFSQKIVERARRIAREASAARVTTISENRERL